MARSGCVRSRRKCGSRVVVGLVPAGTSHDLSSAICRTVSAYHRLIEIAEIAAELLGKKMSPRVGASIRIKKRATSKASKMACRPADGSHSKLAEDFLADLDRS